MLGGFKLHGCPGFHVRPSTYPISPFTPPNRDVWVDRFPTEAPAISIVGLYGLARATLEWLHSFWQLFPGRCTWFMDLNSCFQGRPTDSGLYTWHSHVKVVNNGSQSLCCTLVSITCLRHRSKDGFRDGEWRQVWNFCLGVNGLLDIDCSHISDF